jgi:hypothetical protein
MLIRNDDGTFTGGPLDVLLILCNVEEGTFHAAFLEEKPFPGPIGNVQETRTVRLKSKMHHTGGTTDFVEAQQHLEALRQQIDVPDENVVNRPVAWSGSPFVVMVPNWRVQPPVPLSFEGEFDPEEMELGVTFKGRWLRERGATL